MPARPTPVQSAAVAVLIAAIVVTAAFAYCWSDDSDARAAHAEYLVVRQAQARAEATAADARGLLRRVPPADRPDAEEVVAEAERAVREAAEHADRLRADWGRLWRRLGLDVK